MIFDPFGIQPSFNLNPYSMISLQSTEELMHLIFVISPKSLDIFVNPLLPS